MFIRRQTKKMKMSNVLEKTINVAEAGQEPALASDAPKPRKKRSKTNMYFGEREEQAVVDFIKSEDQAQRDRIFNEILKPAFKIMVESIIRRYNLLPPDEEFEDAFDDTMSFLITKIKCFDPTTKYKAYSYCGTICKNYLLLKLTQYSKRVKRNVSYDNPEETLSNTMSDEIDRPDSESSDEKESFLDGLMGCATRKAKEMSMSAKEGNHELTEVDRKVGRAVAYLLNNWHDVFDFEAMGSNKFNKSSVILYIQDMTNLSSREVKRSLKLYSEGYFTAKNEFLKKL